MLDLRGGRSPTGKGLSWLHGGVSTTNYGVRGDVTYCSPARGGTCVQQPGGPRQSRVGIGTLEGS